MQKHRGKIMTHPGWERPAGPRHPCSRANTEGFTLLEVLIAGVIAALALGVVLRGASTGLFATHLAQREAVALSIAQSRLALAAATPVGGEATAQSGRDGAFAWRTRVTPVATTRPGSGLLDFVRHGNDAPATLAAIEAEVFWTEDGRTRSLRLDTQRLGFAVPAAPAP